MGFIKKTIATGIMILAGYYVGYQRAEDPQYRVVRIDNRPYLEDTIRDIRKPITENFQLGNADYRIKGLVNEGQEHLEQILKRQR